MAGSTTKLVLVMPVSLVPQREAAFFDAPQTLARSPIYSDRGQVPEAVPLMGVIARTIPNGVPLGRLRAAARLHKSAVLPNALSTLVTVYRSLEPGIIERKTLLPG